MTLDNYTISSSQAPAITCLNSDHTRKMLHFAIYLADDSNCRMTKRGILKLYSKMVQSLLTNLFIFFQIKKQWPQMFVIGRCIFTLNLFYDSTLFTPFSVSLENNLNTKARFSNGFGTLKWIELVWTEFIDFANWTRKVRRITVSCIV